MVVVESLDAMVWEIMRLAKKDEEYCRRLRELKVAEDTLYKLECDMTLEQRDAVWELWGACTHVDRRLLEIACEQIINKQDSR